jgi:tRNA uridine 5-carboxymethylaminomethyl modification enzyme
MAAAARARVAIGGQVISVEQALTRPSIFVAELAAQGFALEPHAEELPLDAATLEAELKYRGYLKRDDAQRARTESQEHRGIPAHFEYRGIPGLSREMVERLSAVRPATIGQAGRIPGVTPAAVAILAARVARFRRDDEHSAISRG